MKFLNKKTLALAAAATAIALGCPNLAQAESPSWCGPKKASIALLDGYGGNSWRQVTTASGKEEALKCPSITKYEYADGQGDTQSRFPTSRPWPPRVSMRWWSFLTPDRRCCPPSQASTNPARSSCRTASKRAA